MWILSAAPFLRGILAAAVVILSATSSAMSETETSRLEKTASSVTLSDKQVHTFPNLTDKSDTNSFSEEGLAALEARVRRFVTDGDAAGVNTLLVKDGKVIQYVEAGVQQVDDGTPVTKDTIFRIYSMTKPIAGVAIMILYDRGLFELDDPISKYIPEFRGLRAFGPAGANGNRPVVALEREPTMRDLMAHTAGFSYGFLESDPLAKIYREKQILASPDLSTFIDRLSEAPLLFQPGSEWNYSVATDVHGAIIERLSGKTFGAFLEEELFDPLGMSDTGFRVSDEDFGRMADGFIVNPDTSELVKLSEEQIAGFGVNYRVGAPTMESGGFGLASTIDDYARFCQMLANGGEFQGKRILKEETVYLMRQNLLPEDKPLETPGLLGDSGKPGTGFGLNFGVVYNAEVSPTPYGQGTYFWGGLASTWFWIDPEHDLYYIGMVQVYPAAGPVADFRRETADIIYRALKK